MRRRIDSNSEGLREAALRAKCMRDAPVILRKFLECARVLASLLGSRDKAFSFLALPQVLERALGHDLIMP
jgi:hypothetical protein